MPLRDMGCAPLLGKNHRLRDLSGLSTHRRARKPKVCSNRLQSSADIGLHMGERRERNVALPRHAHKLLAELAAAAEDQDHATTPRRSPR